MNRGGAPSPDPQAARRGASVVWLVIVGMVTASTLLLSAFGAANYRIERTGLMRHLREEFSVFSDQVAFAMVFPVWNFDKPQIERILETAMLEEVIYGIELQLFDEGKTIFHRARDSAWIARNAPPKPEVGAFLLEERDLPAGDQLLGRITLHASPRFVRRDLDRLLFRTVAGILALGALISASLYLLLFRLVFKPLRRMEQFAEAVEKGVPDRIELDGAEFHGEMESLRAHLIGMVREQETRYRDLRDATETRDIVKIALQESEERFRQMAESIQEIFFLIDRNTRSVLYMSPIAESILGIPLADLKARPVEIEERMIHPEDQQRMGFYKEEACFKREFNEEFRYLHPDGRQLWLRLRSFPILDAHGSGYRVAGSLADITETKNAQEASRRQEQQLIQADKMSSLGLMVSGAAHEINNPNNLIMLNVDLLKTLCGYMIPVFREYAAAHPDWRPAHLHADEVEQKITELTAGISGGSQRIKRIVGNLKHFSRIDPGGLLEEVDLGKATEAGIAIVENLIRTSTDRFSTDFEAAPPRCRGNFQMLEQVIINLLTNACQALERRTQAIRIRTFYDRGTGEIVLQVEDEGRGIPPEILPRIADPFFTTRRDSGGTGLGLSVSYGIIREHGGKMDFHSEVGRGTRVEFRIPITPVTQG